MFQLKFEFDPASSAEKHPRDACTAPQPGSADGTVAESSTDHAGQGATLAKPTVGGMMV
jgi:hypothetical protein